MITEEQYLAAKKVIEDYEAQNAEAAEAVKRLKCRHSSGFTGIDYCYKQEAQNEFDPNGMVALKCDGHKYGCKYYVKDGDISDKTIT